MKTLLLLAAIGHCQSLPIEDTSKENAAQAIQAGINDKLSIRGGTVDGAVSIAAGSVLTVSTITTNGGGEVYISTAVEIVGAANFSGAASTSTFAGWVDIGLEIVTANTTGVVVTVDCPAGKRVLGGGCYAVAALLNGNRPTDDDTWGCNANGSTNLTAYAICARIE